MKGTNKQPAIDPILYQEEYNRVDQEIKQIQKDLIDTTELNDDIIKNIQLRVRTIVLQTYNIQHNINLSGLMYEAVYQSCFIY